MHLKNLILIQAWMSFSSLAIAQTTQPTTAPTISPAARSALDELKSSYANLKSLDVAGTLAFDLDAGGRKDAEKGEFTGSFQSPAKFRHEMKDDLIAVSNGDKAFVYSIGEKKYLPLDAPKGRTAVEDLPNPLGPELQQQNPSLLLALSTDAAAELSSGTTSVDRDADVVIDGISYQSLRLKSQGQLMVVLIDPKTHLLRQVSIDLKEHLLAQGVPQVNQAMVKIDYTKSTPNASIADTTFAWTPPSDATLAKARPPTADSDQANAADALVGKPAPQFTLKDMSGQDIALAAQKGNVVVLDFWATWCPPCRKGLPSLDQLNKDLSAKGVKVFAINVHEPKETVQKFLDEQKLSMTALLDDQGAVAEKYLVEGIPQTVVIGKDGLVSKVFIGFGPDSEEKERAAVEAVMK
ncbi:MAG TPA: redoxin domain-containing protein [Tepidisphaeraceae bacterium]|nr:redoxin domain-containing protein [Tepidisphaeraceae bacterium]